MITEEIYYVVVNEGCEGRFEFEFNTEEEAIAKFSEINLDYGRETNDDEVKQGYVLLEDGELIAIQMKKREKLALEPETRIEFSGTILIDSKYVVFSHSILDTNISYKEYMKLNESKKSNYVLKSFKDLVVLAKDIEFENLSVVES